MNATVDGQTQLIPGHFACAAIAGMIAQQHPAQPFTFLPMVGFVSPKGSNLKYSPIQMDTGAAGGLYWIIQETEGGAIVSRHQLSTDTTTIEKRELSITKALDYGAKMLRSVLLKYIGQYNISDGFLDTLSIVSQGALAFLVNNGIFKGATINNLIQDTLDPTKVLLDISVQPFYPCNTIRITLII
jgi:hypothetical protein